MRAPRADADGVAVPPETRPRADAVAASLVFAACLACYVATLSPGLVYPVTDSHELTLNALRLGVPHPSGYPLYTWLGFLFVRLVPLGDAAYRMNLMSAVLGAAGVGLLVLVGRRLGLGLVAAVGAALLLGASTTFWSQAVMAEVYAPDVFLLALTLLLLLRWADAPGEGRRFGLFALAFGASLGTHLSNLLFAPAFALFAVASAPAILRRPRLLLVAGGVFALGAAQYLWLPLRGGLFDQYPNEAPVTLGSLWRYTFGAFGELKFAYGPGDQPFRLWFYLQLLARSFAVPFVALGALGMWTLLFRHPARFWLLFGMLLVNAVLFTQFAVRDPDVFFLAGYVPFALFVGFGVQGVLDAAARRRPALGRAATVVATVALAVGVLAAGRASWREQDASGDTRLADFGPNAFAMLPPGGFVVAPRGAFGADMLYWQQAHGLRPDVVVLGQRGAPPRPPDAPLFTTVRVADGRATPTGRLGHSLQTLPPDAWYVPVLLGNARGLRLSRVHATPPPLVGAAPADRLDRPLGPLVLVAATAALAPDAPSPRLRIESWWRPPAADRFVVSTRLGDRTLESHELGLDVLPRFAAEAGLPDGAVVRERYDVVLPSTLPAGEHAVRLGVTEFSDAGFTVRWTHVATVALD